MDYNIIEPSFNEIWHFINVHALGDHIIFDYIKLIVMLT